MDSNFALVDNIVASYPPMTADIHVRGAYDASATGADVTGWGGGFSVPFLSPGLTGVKAFADCSYQTNAAMDVNESDFALSNVQFIYRWRYLNQQIGDWQTNAMEQVGNRLVSTDGFNVPEKDGDLEFYFAADQSAPHYEPVDYTTGGKNAVAYGSGWTEAVSHIESRANYTVADALPSGGTDWFMRIRAGVSDYAHIKLVGEVTANGAWGTDMHATWNNERVKMELVGDHTWRYHYYIPANAIGERIRFHFEGVKYVASIEPSMFNISTNVWYANRTNVPYLPYVMVASGSLADNNEAIVELDGSATHLLIEFNDETATFYIARAAYQNFNLWTDATVGYRMNAAAGDARRRYDANMGEWSPTVYSNLRWRETFDVEDSDPQFPFYTYVSRGVTPTGWSAENGMYVPCSRSTPYGHAFQMEGNGYGCLAMDSAAVPLRGVGTVNFTARLAQSPDFYDFAVNSADGYRQSYAISAKVTMSQLYDSITSTHRNPLDISPANPSVSLVGYCQGYYKGCYEFRVTRSGDQQLTVALFRWRNGEATELVRNVLNASGNATLASGQIALNVGGTLYSWTTSGSAYNSFGNLLIPQNTDDVRKNQERWTCMCLSLYTDESTGEVRLDGFLSKSHNTSRISDDPSTVRVIAYRDSGSDLKKGSFGVGSAGCQAGFGLVYTHDFNDNSDYTTGINLSTPHDSAYLDWDYMPDRWCPLSVGETFYNASGFSAVIPTNQTVEVLLGDENGNWYYSGCETYITTFASNIFSMVIGDNSATKVLLQTGEADTDVAIDRIEVTSWLASDTPNLVSRHGLCDEWAYTMASIEASAEIEGASYELVEAGTNGYAFIFNEAGVVTFTPKVDMVIDRALLVGGGGAGGWTIGGGGGGGGVLDYDWTDAPVTVPAGTPLTIRVGEGGNNYYNSNNNSSYWRQGTSGGVSRVQGIPGKTLDDARGGGAGGSWSGAGYRYGLSGASGGGSCNKNTTRASGTSGQGFAGGAASNESPGGGGGAGEAGQDGFANTSGNDGQAGKGGDGKASDITGSVVYYGGGGGGGGGQSCGGSDKTTQGGGAGGRGGGGRGANRSPSAATKDAAEDGIDGLGGGGGGGGHSNGNAGGKGGCGCVILRVRTASKICVLQPTRSNEAEYPIGLRSPFMYNGLSTFGFSYRDADSNVTLRLQISTNLVDEGEVYSRTRESADSANWTTLTNWSFANMTASQRAGGSLTHFLSLRAPQKGLMRLVMDSAVVENALMQMEGGRDVDYGKITITEVYCYDEPPLDPRSWLGWNIHTEGWYGGSVPGQWAYLNDAPDGLSCSLNFSALASDNDPSRPETYGIGLGEPSHADEYAANNPFVQCPVLTNGVGSVTFKARTFETNALWPSVVLLYGSTDPDAYQPDPVDGQAWKRLAEFVVSNNTYQTYCWKTNNSPFCTVRLEVGGARHGRDVAIEAWEMPTYADYTPIQRVFLDEVTVAEPVEPRVKFFDVRPFRDNLNGEEIVAITNINDRNEQPLLGESWGIQARIEPQQMSDELDLGSLSVKMATFVGKRPWGYQNWKDSPSRYEAELVCVDKTNLIFRSTYDNPASVISPLSSMDLDEPYAVVQYHVWVEYKTKDATRDTKPIRYDLSAADWVKPEWYWPKDFNKEFGLDLDENFSAFTILDTVSPGRAWFNEVNYNNDDYSSNDYQFIELMVPENVDLTGWSIRLTDDTFRNGFLAEFGSMAQPIVSKSGTRPGIDSMNHFTVVTFVPPNGAGMFSEGQSDGIWNRLSSSGLALQDGSLKKGNIYGMELIRPSGVVEHQIVTAGTNLWAGSIFESKGDATNFVNDVKARDGSEAWFYVGDDRGGEKDTLGVWRGHGEQFWDGSTTWTNDLVATPGELNLRGGIRQMIDSDWFPVPNGTARPFLGAMTDGNPSRVYCEGDSASLTFALRNMDGTDAPFALSDMGYIFLVPQDEASSNLVETTAFEEGVRIFLGQSATDRQARLHFLDGAANTVLRYEFEIWDTADRSGRRIDGYSSGEIVLYVNNVMPTVEGVSMNDTPLFTGGGTMGAKAAKDVTNVFRIKSVDEPSDIDLEDENFMAEWKFYEGDAVLFTTNVYGNPYLAEVPYVFHNSGTNKVTVKVKDKDMSELAFRNAEPFTFFVETLGEPIISLEPYYGSFCFAEDQVGSLNGRVDVKLNIAPTEPIVVQIDIVRDGYDDGITSLPVLNTNLLTFTAGTTSRYFYFKELDGDANYILRARVITETQSVDPNKTWAEYYRLEEEWGYPMTVENNAPMIQGIADTNAYPASIGVPTSPIRWTAKDVLPDIREGMTASWTVEGAMIEVPISTTNATGALLGTVGGSYSPVFTSFGLKRVTLTVMDKNGGMDIRNYYFVVESPPVEIAVDFGDKTRNLSAEWIGRMMGISAEWVEAHQSLAKSLLEATAANGRLSVVECYALGLDPENPNEDFAITEFPMKANGLPDLANLKCEPSSDKWELPGLRVRVMGATTLSGPWSELLEEVDPDPAYRFFKVEVVLP